MVGRRGVGVEKISPRAAGLYERQTGPESSSDGLGQSPACRPEDWMRQPADRLRALSEFIVSPTEQPPIGLKRDRMTVSTAHRDPIGVCANPSGCSNVLERCVAVADLAISIKAPGPEASVRLNGNAMQRACGDDSPIRLQTNPHRSVGEININAQLTAIIATPTPERTIALQSHRMSITASNRPPIRFRIDSSWRVGVFECSIAQLATVVIAPTP